MKLVSYRHNGAVRIGAVVGDQVVALNGVLPAAEAIPDDMVEFLEHGDGAMDAARRAVARYEAERLASAATPLASCDLLSPVPRPGKILMGGRNYLRHLDELRKEGGPRGEKIITPPMPHIFAKYHNAVTGHGKPIIYPKIVRQLDLEGELTAVIGKTAYYVEGRARVHRRLHHHERRVRALPAGAGSAHHLERVRDLLPDRPMDGDARRDPRSAESHRADLSQRRRGLQSAHLRDAVHHPAIHRVALARLSA